MSITQRHIADALNVSTITVSRALRDHPDLADETKNRVLDKARELGYHKFGQFGSDRTARRVGIFFYQDEPQEDPLESEIQRTIFLALHKECQNRHFETVVERPFRHELPLVIRNGTVDAAFLFGRYTEDSIARLRDIPLLAISSFIPCQGLPRIVADNLEGMKLVTWHLIELGHREILFLGHDDSFTHLFEQRADGYGLAMRRMGLRPVLRFVPLGEIPQIDTEGFTAVVCSCDGLAHELWDQLAERGLRLPEQCSIAAFDNLATIHGRRLTTYAPDWGLMGQMAANLLLSQGDSIRGRNVTVTVPGKLIVRTSTARPVVTLSSPLVTEDVSSCLSADPGKNATQVAPSFLMPSELCP